MLVIIFVGMVVSILAAVLAVGLANLRSQRKAVPEWTEWRRTAKRLSWRDRFEVYRATTQGRAVSRPELAEFALQRCTAVRLLLEKRNAGLGARWRRWVMIIFFANGALAIARAIFEPHVASLGPAIVYLTLGYLMTPAMQTKTNERALTRLRQAAEANARAHA